MVLASLRNSGGRPRSSAQQQQQQSTHSNSGGGSGNLSLPFSQSTVANEHHQFQRLLDNSQSRGQAAQHQHSTTNAQQLLHRQRSEPASSSSNMPMSLTRDDVLSQKEAEIAQLKRQLAEAEARARAVQQTARTPYSNNIQTGLDTAAALSALQLEQSRTQAMPKIQLEQHFRRLLGQQGQQMTSQSTLQQQQQQQQQQRQQQQQQLAQVRRVASAAALQRNQIMRQLSAPVPSSHQSGAAPSRQQQQSANHQHHQPPLTLSPSFPESNTAIRQQQADAAQLAALSLSNDSTATAALAVAAKQITGSAGGANTNGSASGRGLSRLLPQPQQTLTNEQLLAQITSPPVASSAVAQNTGTSTVFTGFQGLQKGVAARENKSSAMFYPLARSSQQQRTLQQQRQHQMAHQPALSLQTPLSHDQASPQTHSVGVSRLGPAAILAAPPAKSNTSRAAEHSSPYGLTMGTGLARTSGAAASIRTSGGSGSGTSVSVLNAAAAAMTMATQTPRSVRGSNASTGAGASTRATADNHHPPVIPLDEIHPPNSAPPRGVRSPPAAEVRESTCRMPPSSCCFFVHVPSMCALLSCMIYVWPLLSQCLRAQFDSFFVNCHHSCFCGGLPIVFLTATFGAFVPFLVWTV